MLVAATMGSTEFLIIGIVVKFVLVARMLIEPALDMSLADGYLVWSLSTPRISKSNQVVGDAGSSQNSRSLSGVAKTKIHTRSVLYTRRMATILGPESYT